MATARKMLLQDWEDFLKKHKRQTKRYSLRNKMDMISQNMILYDISPRPSYIFGVLREMDEIIDFVTIFDAHLAIDFILFSASLPIDKQTSVQRLKKAAYFLQQCNSEEKYQKLTNYLHEIENQT